MTQASGGVVFRLLHNSLASRWRNRLRPVAASPQGIRRWSDNASDPAMALSMSRYW